MPHESFTELLALVGIVIIVSSLLSGAIERTGLPQVAIFLLLGAGLGPAGLGLIELGLDSPSLQVIATLASSWCSSATPSASTSRRSSSSTAWRR